MTFTYGEDLTDNGDFVRFHSGDTVSAQAYLTDEIITSILAVESSKQHAVIAAIQYIVARLSQPNFSADWLTVSHEQARKGYETVLAMKRREFGISKHVVSTTHVYRVDSDATEEPYQ